MTKKRLRHGFTTGSSAAAAAKAALLYLAGRKDIKEVNIPLPQGGRLTIPLLRIEELNEGAARAIVKKDAGDDPDVTHRAMIMCTIRILPGTPGGDVIIAGGSGVGKVTRPGLPVPVGESAINPVPRRQIKEAVLEALDETGLKGTVSATIEVVNGEKIAKKTLNPRLGIIGGISILGTRGTVKPFSNKAYQETITMSMDVARAAGLSCIALSTGGRSERYLREKKSDLPETAFIQVADFFSFSLKEAVKRGFVDILYCCFFGKLVKMAQGRPNTHAKRSRINFEQLSKWCASMGIGEDKALRIEGANTAREALEVILAENQPGRIIQDIAGRALASARGFAGPGPDITYYLFDFEGRLLVDKKSRGVTGG